jgi:glycosyltransferase involved in cell wall biosynthesis
MTLRVLQVCPVRAPELGLVERLDRWPTVPDVAAAVSAAGAEVTVLLDGPAETLHRAGIRYRQLPGLARPSWRHPLEPRVAGIARSCRPDVIHMMGLEAPLLTRALCGIGRPVLAQDHCSLPKGRGAPLWRWGHARLAAVAFTAAAQADSFLRARQLPKSARIYAVPESSSGFMPGDQAEARARTGLHGAPALLWVGHLSTKKNPLMVLRAMQRVVSALPGAMLWCAFGNAPLRAEIDALLASDPELCARVRLLGHVPHAEMEWLYRAADAFVSASRHEGSGYALIEALACGLPAFVTDIPPFRELTGGGLTGALVPLDDAAAMAAALCRSFASGSLPDDARRRAVRRHFEAQLSFEVVGAKLVRAYADLAGAHAQCASR